MLGATTATVEDEEDWLLLVEFGLLLDVLLVLAQKLRVELDVARLVDTVDISESGSNGKVWRDWRESLVDLVDVFWLGVEGVVVNVLVVYTILLTTGDTDFLDQSAYAVAM